MASSLSPPSCGPPVYLRFINNFSIEFYLLTYVASCNARGMRNREGYGISRVWIFLGSQGPLHAAGFPGFHPPPSSTLLLFGSTGYGDFHNLTMGLCLLAYTFHSLAINPFPSLHIVSIYATNPVYLFISSVDRNI